MVEALAGLMLLVSVAAQPSDDAVGRAKAAEARAFEAIEGERWCDAMHHFLEANAAAPSVDLIYNAAQAADLAEDRKQALKLYVELVGAYPGSERQAEVNARIRELTGIVAEKGEGTECPALPPEEPLRDTEPVPDPVPTEPASADVDTSAGPGVLPWAVVGGGALLMATGGVLAGVGTIPYFGFLDARDKILAAEKAGGDASALQRQQTDARASWQTWGELTAWSGALALVTGALVTTGGLVWALSDTPDEQAEGDAVDEGAPSEDEGTVGDDAEPAEAAAGAE